MFCFLSSSLATLLPGTDVEMALLVVGLVGSAETSAFTTMLSASVEGESSTRRLRCGVARSQTAQGNNGMRSGTMQCCLNPLLPFIETQSASFFIFHKLFLPQFKKDDGYRFFLTL